MPHLRRADDDAPAANADASAVSPAITQAPEGDRRTPPAAERLFAELAAPWDLQIQVLTLARAELEEVIRTSRRLHALRGRILRERRTQQLAEQDLAHLRSERQLAVSRSLTVQDSGGGRRRRRRTDEAKQEAGRLYDARVATTKRITTTRLNTASRELAELRAEEAQLAQQPLVVDPALLAWVEDTAAAVEATLDRDRDARARTLEPWTRLRIVDSRVVDALRRAANGDILPGQAFGQGPIHLVAGEHLALVELRQGRDGSVALEEGEDGEERLWQIRPSGDEPLGLTDGSTRDLLEAADAVETAIGRRPETIVCVSGWSRAADQLGSLHLCGPVTVEGVVAGLDPQDVTVEELRAAARALTSRPLPDVSSFVVASLEHVAQIHVEDVPEGLPATRTLVVYAHERRHAEL